MEQIFSGYLKLKVEEGILVFTTGLAIHIRRELNKTDFILYKENKNKINLRKQKKSEIRPNQANLVKNCFCLIFEELSLLKDTCN